jgi:5-methylcytosine-specific restriction endonuclease McrA
MNNNTQRPMTSKERYDKWMSNPANLEKRKDYLRVWRDNNRDRDNSAQRDRRLIDRQEKIDLNLGNACDVYINSCLCCQSLKFGKDKNDMFVCHICKTRIVSFAKYSPNKSWFGQCKQCGICFNPFFTDIVSKYKMTYVCSESCRSEYRHNAKKSQKDKSSKGHRARAKKYGSFYIHFDVRLIYQRDGYKCKMCGVKVVKGHNNRGEYRKNLASIDHIIPLSMGGPHSPENCQTLCVECNSKKGNAIQPYQLSIFHNSHAPQAYVFPQQ